MRISLDVASVSDSQLSSNPKFEMGLLQVRLVVASIGAVIIGFLSATTLEIYGRKTRPNVTENAVPTPHLPASPNLKSVARLVPDPILGFAVIAVARQPNVYRY